MTKNVKLHNYYNFMASARRNLLISILTSSQMRDKAQEDEEEDFIF